MTTTAAHPDLEERLARLPGAGHLELGTFPAAVLACLQLPSRSGLWRTPIALPPAEQVDLALTRLSSAGLVAFDVPAGAPRHVTAAIRRPGDGGGALPPAGAPRVAVFGDLALVLALQASPTWVAEVHDPTGDAPDVVLHGGAAPPAVLEQRRATTGDPAFALLHPDAALRDLAARCWAARETHLRVARPAGQQVRVKAVAVRRHGLGATWRHGDGATVEVRSAARLEDMLRALLAPIPGTPRSPTRPQEHPWP